MHSKLFPPHQHLSSNPYLPAKSLWWLVAFFFSSRTSALYTVDMEWSSFISTYPAPLSPFSISVSPLCCCSFLLVLLTMKFCKAPPPTCSCFFLQHGTTSIFLPYGGYLFPFFSFCYEPFTQFCCLISTEVFLPLLVSSPKARRNL